MERAFPYKGYSIVVRAQALPEPAAGGDLLQDTGFMSVVEIFNGDGPIPSCPRLHLTEAHGRGFRTLNDALVIGLTAGQHLVDDLVPDAT